MLSMEEVFFLFEKIGHCSFATLDGRGGIDSRTAHFFAWGEEGLYLRTMSGKPFFRQLRDGGVLSVCGDWAEAPATWDEDNMPHSHPGYMMRVTGQVRLVPNDEVAALAERDYRFGLAVHDIKKYPETVVLLLHRGWGELYDYDWNCVNRDHKLERQRFAWGGATFEDPGFRITDDCTGCGACARACTFKAVEPGTPYRIRGERCDECGNCHHVCPVGAVVEKANVTGGCA